MKKILLLSIFGLLFISCSVDPIETELQESQLLEMNVISNSEEVGCAGQDNSMTITYSEAAAIESWDEVRKLYLSLLAEGLYRGGSLTLPSGILLTGLTMRKKVALVNIPPGTQLTTGSVRTL